MRLVADDVRYEPLPGTKVLGGVSLTVEAPEALAVVGPSGSGKTSLLAILGGLLQPSGGCAGVDQGDGTLHRAGPYVAWVFQTTNALGRRTGLENVALAAYARGLGGSEARQIAAEMLDRVGLSHAGDRRADTLSGGEVQRLGIARALALDAPFLLADEPTGQLDRATSDAIADVLIGDCLGDVARVVVTHDPEVAGRCHRQLQLSNGVVREG